MRLQIYKLQQGIKFYLVSAIIFAIIYAAWAAVAAWLNVSITGGPIA
jgi:hypothetical protein